MDEHMKMKLRNYRRWERSRAYQKKRANAYQLRLQAKLLKAQEATENEQPSLPLLESERISPNPHMRNRSLGPLRPAVKIQRS